MFGFLVVAFDSPAPPADVTPDPVDWTDIGPTPSPGMTSTETISGITAPITLSAVNSGSGFLEYRIGSGSYTSYSSPFVVTNGQTVRWRVTSFIGVETGTVTVNNDSDPGNNPLDTFIYSVDGGSGP